MKKIINGLYVLILTALLLGVSPVKVKAENVYKAYVVGEKITAQIDDEGHTGNFIVIENSDTKSDEVAVIQQNNGLNGILEGFKMDSLKVTNARIGEYRALQLGPINAFLSNAPSKMNGYIRTKDKPFGMMTKEDYDTLSNKYGADYMKKIFEGQNYWLPSGDADKIVPGTDTEGYKINEGANTITYGSGSPQTFKDNSRILNAVYQEGEITTDHANTKYEPAIKIVLCKKNIVTPNVPNADTADMNIIMLTIVGILSSAVIVISTKKILSI